MSGFLTINGLWKEHFASLCLSSVSPSLLFIFHGLVATEGRTLCPMLARQMPHPQSRLVTLKPWEELAHPDDTLIQPGKAVTSPGSDLGPASSYKSGPGSTGSCHQDKKAKFHSSLLLPVTLATIQRGLELRTGFYFYSTLKIFWELIP